jgi:hypothetical protein
VADVVVVLVVVVRAINQGFIKEKLIKYEKAKSEYLRSSKASKRPMSAPNTRAIIMAKPKIHQARLYQCSLN